MDSRTDAPSEEPAPAHPDDASVADAVTDGSPSLAATLDQGMRMIEDVASIVHDTENDCVAMARRLDQYDAAHAEFIDMGLAMYRETSDEERMAIHKEYRARFKAAWRRLRPGIMRCKSNPKVAFVAEELWKGKRRPEDIVVFDAAAVPLN